MAQYESYGIREIDEIAVGMHRLFRTDYPDPGNQQDLCNHTDHISATEAHNCPDARSSMTWPPDQ